MLAEPEAPAPRGAGALARALRIVHRVEDGALALLLGVMVVLAPAQIVLRNFFEADLAWGDALLRVLVLWVALLGALLASRADRHIGVDALSRVLPARAHGAAHAITSLFTAAVAALVAYQSGRLVASEFEFGTLAFAAVPAWVCQVVLPFAFGLMAVRHGLRGAQSCRVLLGPRDGAP